MFSLEQSILGWRKQMLAAGIKSPVLLEELEIHLRDEIERQIKPGMNEQESFNSAVQKIGRPSALQREFQKTITGPAKINRMMSLVVGIATISAGLFQLWELAVQSRCLGGLPNAECRLVIMFLLAFILALTLAGSGAILVFYAAGKISWLPDARRKEKHV